MGNEKSSLIIKAPAKNEKLYSVEFLRFIFACVIVYFHFLHTNIMNYTGGSAFYQKLADNCSGDKLVECFFILSGFFLFFTFKKHKEMSFGRFVYSKVSRLWPVLFFVVAVETIFFNRGVYNGFFNALFLQCIGLTTEYKGINWYVSPLFWSLLFYFGLHKLVKKEKNFCFFVALISYFGYVVIFNSDEGVLGRDIVFGFLSTALFRSLAGMGIGYLVAAVVTGLKENGVESRVRQSKLGNVLFTVCVSFAEIASLVLIFLNCFSEKLKCKNDLFVVIVFAVLLISLSFKCGLVSRIINNRFFGFFGRYSYSIYLIQQTVMWTLQKTLWQNSSFVQDHALRCLALSLVIVVIAGIAVYYIVEMPSAKLFKMMEKKLFVTKEK